MAAAVTQTVKGDAPEAPVRLSETAAARINLIMKKKGDAEALRVAIDGGGCSGFSYVFDFADSVEDGDLIIERDGAKVYVDPVSLDLLQGSEIDYVTELIGASFQINNPNAKSSCGCGTSFSV